MNHRILEEDAGDGPNCLKKKNELDNSQSGDNMKLWA